MRNAGCRCTRRQVAPSKVNTAQLCGDQQVAAPIVTAIAVLPGPVNGPHRTCMTGSGRRKLLSLLSLTSCVAVALEQSAPGAAGAVAEGANASMAATQSAARTER